MWPITLRATITCAWPRSSRIGRRRRRRIAAHARQPGGGRLVREVRRLDAEHVEPGGGEGSHNVPSLLAISTRNDARSQRGHARRARPNGRRPSTRCPLSRGTRRTDGSGERARGAGASRHVAHMTSATGKRGRPARRPRLGRRTRWRAAGHRGRAPVRTLTPRTACTRTCGHAHAIPRSRAVGRERVDLLVGERDDRVFVRAVVEALVPLRGERHRLLEIDRHDPPRVLARLLGVERSRVFSA